MNRFSVSLIRIILIVFHLFLFGCSELPKRIPLPAELEDQVQIDGIPEARFWGDGNPNRLENKLKLTKADFEAQYPAWIEKPHNFLALSGGGAEGSFGAGLLAGWTQSGKRPSFQVVTGVSTGALIAPWAFLGSDYDSILTKLYTTVATGGIIKRKRILPSLFSDSFLDSTPLFKKIQKYINDDIVQLIAREHSKGRRLFIGTAAIDQMRGVIWDIGAIAASQSPNAKALIHKIILASTSIPGAFPPVRINVVAAGKQYDELHVDGGTIAQVFTYPVEFQLSKIYQKFGLHQKPNIYVIRNATLKPVRKVVKPQILTIAMRSIFSVIRSQGIGDLYIIYMQTIREKGNYHLAYIPDNFDAISEEAFDKNYMNQLYSLGYELAKNSYQWRDRPPGWEYDSLFKE